MSDDVGNVALAERQIIVGLSFFPQRFFLVVAFSQSQLTVTQCRRHFEILLGDCLRLFTFDLPQLVFHLPMLGRGGEDLQAQTCRRLVDQIDGFVGQKTVVDIANRHGHRRVDRLLGDGQPVVRLIF